MGVCGEFAITGISTISAAESGESTFIKAYWYALKVYQNVLKISEAKGGWLVWMKTKSQYKSLLSL